MYGCQEETCELRSFLTLPVFKAESFYKNIPPRSSPFPHLLDFSYIAHHPLCPALSLSIPGLQSVGLAYGKENCEAETEEAHIRVLSLLSAYCVTLGELLSLQAPDPV